MDTNSDTKIGHHRMIGRSLVGLYKGIEELAPSRYRYETRDAPCYTPRPVASPLFTVAAAANISVATRAIAGPDGRSAWKER